MVRPMINRLAPDEPPHEYSAVLCPSSCIDVSLLSSPTTVMSFNERLAREYIYDAIDHELEAQIAKHGRNAIPFVSLSKQFSITEEEGLEAIEALTRYLLNLTRGVNDGTELKNELIQLAACAIGMATSIDLRKVGEGA